MTIVLLVVRLDSVQRLSFLFVFKARRGGTETAGPAKLPVGSIAVRLKDAVGLVYCVVVGSDQAPLARL
jgi:hypothetical protein